MEAAILTAIDPSGAKPDATPPRAIGSLRITAKRRGAHSVIDDLHQSGCLRALFPRHDGQGLQSVFVNTAGGITGGDKLSIEASAGRGTRLTLASQTAERLYRARPYEIGQVSVSLRVADEGRIDWLPQETILFDRCAVRRRLEVDLERRGQCLLVESLILGRFGMGERVHEGLMQDDWRVRRDGKLIFADALRLQGDVAAMQDSPGVLNGAVAMASLLFVHPVAQGYMRQVRDMMPQGSAANLIEDGVMFVRMTAQDAHSLRKVLIPLITLLQGGDIPRPWMI